MNSNIFKRGWRRSLGIVFTFSFLCLGVLTSSAQSLSFKVSGGANVSRALGNSFYSGQRSTAGYGYGVEAGLRYQLGAGIAVETGLLHQANRYRVSNAAHPAIATNYHDDFLDSPLLLSYRVWRLGSTELQLLAGGYGSYWLSSRAQGSYANVFETEWNPTNETEVIALQPFEQRIALDDGQYNRFSLGYSVGLGATRPIGRAIAVGLRALMQQDLLDRLAGSSYQRRYQRFGLQASLFYTLRSHK